jgi:DNA polymerase sigma
MELISTAKTPLIAISIKERGESDIKVDIIINNILGIINSRFLKAYSVVRWVKNLGLLVKLWGKNCSLISKSNLSSYAMVLMLIHYLIRERKVQPLMDSRVTSS